MKIEGREIKNMWCKHYVRKAGSMLGVRTNLSLETIDEGAGGRQQFREVSLAALVALERAKLV